MFLLSVFVLAQFLLSSEISGKDAVLNRLNSQINELTQLLALERSNTQDAKDSLANLQSSLSAASRKERGWNRACSHGAGSANAPAQHRTRCRASSTAKSARSASAQAQPGRAAQPADRATAQADRRAGTGDSTLPRPRTASPTPSIADLGSRLNVALAQRVQELNRYRSDFFGRLREVLSDRENIRIVGDRFVFQSEVLFPVGSEVINDAGRVEMKKLADAIIELQKEIPPEINWVLRVDGHTDNRPLSGTGRYRDNWELSSARATSVVKFLIENGVPARPARRCRLRRIPAARYGRHRRRPQQEPPHRTEAHRAVRQRIFSRSSLPDQIVQGLRTKKWADYVDIRLRITDE
jgi:chemotaxis protein MotB